MGWVSVEVTSSEFVEVIGEENVGGGRKQQQQQPWLSQVTYLRIYGCIQMAVSFLNRIIVFSVGVGGWGENRGVISKLGLSYPNYLCAVREMGSWSEASSTVN